MHSKTRIAALITALALGAQAGFAATVESATPGTVVLNVETVEPTAIKELPGSQAVKPETATTPIPATASAPPAPAEEPATILGWFSSLWDRIVSAFRSAPAASSSSQTASPAPAEPVASSGTPVTGIPGWFGLVRATPSSTFPIGDSDTEWQILPSQVAYFERIERERRHLVARGDVFPVGDSDTEWQILPVQVAYFDRIERERIAAARPTQPANAVQAEAAPASASSNPLRTAADYITSLFKSDSASAPAEVTAAK